MELVSIRQRPDLGGPAFAIPYPADNEAFMQGNRAALLVRARRLLERWPHLVLVLLDDGHRPVARGVMVPFASQGEERDRFPDGGWDQVAVWAAEDALDGRPTDTLCALEIAVHPELQGRGLSTPVLAGMRRAAEDAGMALVAPVRPPDKASEPWTPMAEYAARTRPDGLPADRWLRVHVRSGGRVIGVARCSGTVQASLEAWRAWTGLALDRDGPVAVAGGLAPLWVDTASGVGVYVEANVWVDHSS